MLKNVLALIEGLLRGGTQTRLLVLVFMSLSSCTVAAFYFGAKNPAAERVIVLAFGAFLVSLLLLAGGFAFLFRARRRTR